MGLILTFAEVTEENLVGGTFPPPPPPPPPILNRVKDSKNVEITRNCVQK